MSCHHHKRVSFCHYSYFPSVNVNIWAAAARRALLDCASEVEVNAKRVKKSIPGPTIGSVDPFDMDQDDLTKCGALSSSLWEVAVSTHMQ